MDADDADKDRFFDRLRPETLIDGNWVVVYQKQSLTISRKTFAPEVVFLRVEYSVDLSYDDHIVFLRPEVFFDPRRPSYDSGLSGCGLERFLSPGEAICWHRPVFGTASASLAVARAAVVGTAQVVRDTQPGDALLSRWIFRRSFPSPDHIAVVTAPFCAETGTLWNESGVKIAVAAAICKHPDDPENRCAVKEIRCLRQVHDWSMEHIAGYYFQREEWIARYKVSSVYKEVRSSPDLFVVVSIGKLSKGPPLLPKNYNDESVKPRSDSYWEPDVSTTCAEYLRTFLHRIGIDVEVYSIFYGQHLVYYQAALRRSDWGRACAVLDSGLWRHHGSAYRRINGSKSTPKLAITSEPRYRDQPRVIETQSFPATDQALRYSSYRADLLPVVGTFVHVSEHPVSEHPRRNSDPELDVAAL